MDRYDHKPHEILKDGKPLDQLSRKELLKLAYDAVRFQNVNHVEFTRIGEP